jgi:hypothetical protein
MTAARKYHGFRKKRDGGEIKPIGTVLNAQQLERITAYDARDVEPLVEAARNAFVRFGELGMYDPYLEAALTPFDSEEKT